LRRPADLEAAVLGIDACRNGWVGVAVRPPSDGVLAAVVAVKFAELVAQLPDPAVVAVDMPVGLSDTGVRAADVAARAALGRRWPTIFLTPVRQAVEASTYAEASAAHRAVTGGGLSRQAWALTAKLAEVEAWRLATGREATEVHPELVFAELAGAPLADSKKTWAGMVRRRALLAGAGIVVPDDLGPAGAAAGVDDVLDAAAVAWTACRVAAGTARSLPSPPELDRQGRPMAIWV
jgi:predicted RNase H-like nuclease